MIRLQSSKVDREESKASSVVLGKVMVFGDRAFRELVKLKWGLRMGPSPIWLVFLEEFWIRRHQGWATQRKDHVRRQPEGCYLQAKEISLGRNQTYWRLDFGLLGQISFLIHPCIPRLSHSIWQIRGSSSSLLPHHSIAISLFKVTSNVLVDKSILYFLVLSFLPFQQYLTLWSTLCSSVPPTPLLYLLLFQLFLFSLIWGFLLFCLSVKCCIFFGVLSLAVFSQHSIHSLEAISSIPMSSASTFC